MSERLAIRPLASRIDGVLAVRQSAQAINARIRRGSDDLARKLVRNVGRPT